MTMLPLFVTRAIQQIGARIAAEYFSNQWHTEVRISGFSFGFSKGVDIEGIDGQGPEGICHAERRNS